MSVKVQLQGDGLNYETEATVIQAAKIIGFLNTQDPLLNDYSSSQQNNLPARSEFFDGTPRPQISSPREALLESGAKTNVQKILVLGVYITERDASDEFASTELKTLFLKSGESAPRNLARDIREAIRAGYIAESFDNSDSFIVTNTGRRIITEGFSISNKQTTHRRKKSNGTSKSGLSKAYKAPDWLENSSVIDQLSGFPGYRKMKTRSDKILWILQWANLNGGNQLSGSDIEYVAKKLSDNVPNRQVASSLSPYLSKSLVSKNSDGYIILYDGTEFLKGKE